MKGYSDDYERVWAEALVRWLAEFELASLWRVTQIARQHA